MRNLILSDLLGKLRINRFSFQNKDLQRGLAFILSVVAHEEKFKTNYFFNTNLSAINWMAQKPMLVAAVSFQRKSVGCFFHSSDAMRKTFPPAVHQSLCLQGHQS